ncbi:hypothetical protein HDU97_009947 [Phlyctochytrium planicorne]|nr:hypothetical protein HDU97_009947 [Phlyctochytrium planicorne]
MRQRPSLVAQLSSSIVDAPSPYVSAQFEWPTNSPEHSKRPRSRSECRTSIRPSISERIQEEGGSNRTTLNPRNRSTSVPPKSEQKPQGSTPTRSNRSSVTERPGSASGGGPVLYPDEDKPLQFFSQNPSDSNKQSKGKKSVGVRIAGVAGGKGEGGNDGSIKEDDEQHLVHLMSGVSTAPGSDQPTIEKRVSTATKTNSEVRNEVKVPLADNRDTMVTEVDKLWFEAVAGHVNDANGSADDIYSDFSKEEARIMQRAEEEEKAFKKRLVTSADIKESWVRRQRIIQAAEEKAKPAVCKEEVCETKAEPCVVETCASTDEDKSNDEGIPEVQRETIILALESTKSDQHVHTTPSITHLSPHKPKSRMSSASKRAPAKKKSTLGVPQAASNSGRPTSSRARTPK